MNIEVYSRDLCSYCEMAKRLLQSKDMDFQEKKIGRDLTRDEFLEKFPNVRTVPQIVIDGTNIGGYTELVKYFNG